MADRPQNPKLKELFQRGVPVYSYSKLDSYHTCQHGYWRGYVLKERSNDNIYNLIGTVIHDGLEDLYTKDKPLSQTKEDFFNCIIEAEKKGIKFPDNPPTTKVNFMKNMEHFFDNYEKMDTKMMTEHFVLLQIPRVENPEDDWDYIWIQMYIDSIIPHKIVGEDGETEERTLIVNDWKTSSKFTGDKLGKSARQLLLYKIGLEQQLPYKISKLGWTMLKYVTCCSYKKDGTVKRSAIQERRNAVKFFTKPLVKDLIKEGMDTLDAEMLVGKCVAQNSMEFLPEHIREKYWIEDAFVEFPFDEETIQETIQWVKDTVFEIESRKGEESKFSPCDIEENSYFCTQLCGRPSCPHLLKFKEDNKDKYKKEKAEEKVAEQLGAPKINFDDMFN